MRKEPAGRALRARTASYFSAVHFHAWFQCYTTHTVEGCRPGHHSLWVWPSKYLVSGSGWESLQTSCFSGFLAVVKVVMCLLKNPTLRYRTKAFGVKTYFCPLILESTSSTCVEECCQLDVECPPRLPGTPGRWCLEGRCQSTGHAQEGDTGIQLSPSPPLCASQQTVSEQSAPSGAPARKGCLKTYPEARQPRDHGQTALKP